MPARKQWRELSQRNRRLLITAAVADGILKVAALIDIKRRPASRIHGPKWLWAVVPYRALSRSPRQGIP